MTERELRRTALIIPPRGRAVLCCWAAIPGLLAAPFVFWQSLPAGMVFCLLWAALVAVVYQRACSYAAALGAETLTVYSGIVFPLRRAVRRRAVTGLFRLRTPLLRLAGGSVVVITAPGTRLILPAVPAEQAAALTHALAEEIRLMNAACTPLPSCGFCARRWWSICCRWFRCCLSGTGQPCTRLCGRMRCCSFCSAQ